MIQMMNITDYLIVAHFADTFWGAQVCDTGTSPACLRKIRVIPMVGRIGKLLAEFIRDFLQIGRKLVVGREAGFGRFFGGFHSELFPFIRFVFFKFGFGPFCLELLGFNIIFIVVGRKVLMVVWFTTIFGSVQIIIFFHEDIKLLLSWSFVLLVEIIGIDCPGLAHSLKLYGVNLALVVKKKNLSFAKDVMLNCLGAAGLWRREFFYHLLVKPADIAPAFPLQFIADSSDAFVVVFADFIKEAGRQFFDSLLALTFAVHNEKSLHGSGNCHITETALLISKFTDILLVAGIDASAVYQLADSYPALVVPEIFYEGNEGSTAASIEGRVAEMRLENFVQAFMGKVFSVKKGLLIVLTNCFQGCNPDTSEFPSPVY